MAITKAVLLTRSKQVTGRTELTDIDEELTESLIQLSKDTLVLKATETGTMSSGSITKPSDMLSGDDIAGIDALQVNNDVLDPISLKEWREGKIEGYVIRNGIILVIPSSSKSYSLYYVKENSDPDSIEFADEYKLALLYMLCSKIYENNELEENAVLYGQKYQRELDDLTPALYLGSEIRERSNLRI